MALIENLVVALGLTSSSFSAGMKKAGSDLTDFEKKVAGIQNGIMGFGKNLLMGAIGFLGFKSIIENIGSAMDRMFSQGMSAAKLGMEIDKFTSLAYAVGSVGIETEKFDTAMQKMLVTVSNALSGDDSAVSTMKKLGISVESLRDASPDKLLGMMADGLLRVDNAAQRMGMTRSIFGRGGAGMINIMRDGSAGIQEMARRAEFLGVKISAIDMSKIINMRTAWYDLGQAVKGMWNSITINLAEPMSIMFRDLSNAVANLRIQSGLFTSEFNEGISTSVFLTGALYSVIMSLVNAFKVLTYATASWASMLYAAGSWFTGGGLEGADYWMDIATRNTALMERALKDLEFSITGGYFDYILNEIKKLKKNKLEGLEGDAPATGSERIAPGAYYRGTKEAAEAAFKAGGQDELTDVAKFGVLKLSELNGKADKMNERVLAISGALGLEAGIV